MIAMSLPLYVSTTEALVGTIVNNFHMLLNLKSSVIKGHSFLLLEAETLHYLVV